MRNHHSKRHLNIIDMCWALCSSFHWLFKKGRRRIDRGTRVMSLLRMGHVYLTYESGICAEHCALHFTSVNWLFKTHACARHQQAQMPFNGARVFLQVITWYMHYMGSCSNLHELLLLLLLLHNPFLRMFPWMGYSLGKIRSCSLLGHT